MRHSVFCFPQPQEKAQTATSTAKQEKTLEQELVEDPPPAREGLCQAQRHQAGYPEQARPLPQDKVSGGVFPSRESEGMAAPLGI